MLQISLNSPIIRPFPKVSTFGSRSRALHVDLTLSTRNLQLELCSNSIDGVCCHGTDLSCDSSCGCIPTTNDSLIKYYFKLVFNINILEFPFKSKCCMDLPKNGNL